MTNEQLEKAKILESEIHNVHKQVEKLKDTQHGLLFVIAFDGQNVTLREDQQKAVEAVVLALLESNLREMREELAAL